MDCSSQTLQARRVLVVDDEPAALETVHSILRHAGYDVTCLDTAEEARRALHTTADRARYNLVLTDLYLDDDHLGFEIADLAHAQRPELPVVVLTGRPSFYNAREALRAKVAEIVVKPVDGDDLLAACDRAITAAEIEQRNRDLEAQNAVLSRLVPRMIEAKDPTTHGHAERVVRYAEHLAIRCGVPNEQFDDLRLAALLHDVGKIGVSQRILTKEGPLDAAERAEIERHPQIGYDILADLQHSERVRNWVYQHHERWDGRGYPNGLRGDEVALPGRILILAEVYDALAEARSYKPAWPVPRIVDFFREHSGRHFDPDLAHLVADGLERHGRRFFDARPGQLF